MKLIELFKINRIRNAVVFAVFVTVIILIAVFYYMRLYSPLARTSSEAVTQLILVEKGSSLRLVANNIVAAGITENTKGLMLAAKIKSAQSKIKAGEYELTSAMSPMQIIDILISGKVKRYAVTVPEGYAMKDIALLMEKAGLATKEVFLTKATDKDFVLSFGIEAKVQSGYSLEGYLFPDTYYFTKAMTLDEMIRKMVERFNVVYNEQMRAKARERGLTMKQVVTLASIIEKETGVSAEMPLISAIFTNRLKKGYRLESDPTVIYGIKDFDGNIRRRDLETVTPYNTYRVFGLPPGPIASPGKNALEAALNPAPVPYLYFVSKNDGTHYFSSTLTEHNRAVNTYQKRGRKKQPAANASN